MALNSFAAIAILITVSFLGGTYVIDNDLGQSFCLGAFSTGLAGAVALLGYHKLARLAVGRHAPRAHTDASDSPPTTTMPGAARPLPLFAGVLELVERPAQSTVLNSLAASALLVATLFLAGTYVFESDMGQSFCLGAFATGLAGSMLLLGYTKVARIAERKRVEQALRASEARFRTWIEHASDMISVLSPDGTIRFEAPAVERILGYPPDALVGRSMFDFLHPDSADAFRATLEGVARETGLISTLRYRFRHADGGWRVLEASAKCVENGPQREIISNSRDITERTRMEEDLHASEERFRDFAETAADYFWEMDRNHRLTYVSERFQEKTRLRPETALGSSRSELLSGYVTDRESWAQHLEDLEARQPFSDFELELGYPDGALRVLRDSGKPVFDRCGEFVGYRGATRDVTDAHVLAEKLSYQAKHDPLTGLVNRQHFDERLRRVIDTARRDRSAHVLCYLDLDRFKVVNKTWGHYAGDELLREIGCRLQEQIRLADTLARVGSDQFAVLMERCSLCEGERAAEALRRGIANANVLWRGIPLKVSASAGVVAITDRSAGVAEVLSAADTACFIAKEHGRDRVHVSQEDDAEAAQRHREMLWVNRLERALEEHRFRLSYQRIAPLAEGGLAPEGGTSRVEILLRLEDETGAIVPPSVFLPAAERYALSHRIDAWVIDRTTEWLGQHPAELERLELCSINLSGHSLTKPSFASQILRRLDEWRVPPEKICFEITETAAIENLNKAMRFIGALKGRGCRFALDDFGRGLSSFAYLRTLPVDYLKIDGFFVRHAASDPVDYAMLRSINEVGHLMGKKTIAEYADDARTLSALAAIGVDYAQGYGIEEPLPLESLVRALSSRAP